MPFEIAKHTCPKKQKDLLAHESNTENNASI